MIYIIDDDKSIRSTLQAVLEDEDYFARCFASGRTALRQLEKERPDLVLLDVWLGKEDGLIVLDQIRELYPALPVVMISGHATIEQAVQATRKGALDFLEKPLSLELVLQRIQSLVPGIQPPLASQQAEAVLEFDEIIGKSRAILDIKQSISRAARTNARVFIYGENGTGKELVAHAIYRNSRRREFPFVEVNCAAIPEEMIESELLGHEKGSFTGADETRIGRFEQAHKGTIFLDEICDMSLAMQAKVLRVLQEQRFNRVGGSQSVEVDVRVIAATNINPEQAIADGRFREDLYYRLNVIPINMPPLRERQEDIPLIAEYFIREAIRENQLENKRFTNKTMELLQNWSWPGNIRELKNVVERLCVLSTETEVDHETARLHIGQKVGQSMSKSVLDPGVDLKSAREQFEREYIIQALKQCESNVSQTARHLGIERTNLHRKIKQLGIEMEQL
ncbi:MAG: sigma-54-dependent Fis family transcriptional regulator [Leptospiraceae bacterium]|nr:sigma-54-dependent Fis family transcriptional regulator [Leptospiraceae bacterium]